MEEGIEDMNDWRLDTGRPAFALPCIVDAPEGKRDISDWAVNQIRYDYWLALRSGTTEWNARVFIPKKILRTLEHGKMYTFKELGIDPIWQCTFAKLPEKLQFIVEKL